MVQLRGGLRAINTNRILQAFMLWCVAKTPTFCPEPGWHVLTEHQAFDRSRHLQLPTTKPLYIGFHQHVLIADLNAWFSDPESFLDPLDIQNFSCALECLLLTWLRENEHLATPLEDALCVALLIFTVRTTEAFNQQSHVHHLHFAASKRLEKALNCTIRTEWQHCPDLLLWILSIGGALAG